jgi:DNA-binding beta-propeller fold protein YncE
VRLGERPLRRLAFAALLALAAVPAAAADASVEIQAAALPGHVRTIGGPGRAPMYPSGLDVGVGGVVYVADTGNDQVVAYSRKGRQLWRRGTRGDRKLGRFGNPRDVAVLQGRVYVADTAYNRVQVLDASSGRPIKAWDYRFGSLIGISAGRDGAGRPIVLGSEDDRNTITIFTPRGQLVRKLQFEVGSGRGQLNAPRDAATDSDGNIYIADYANNRVVKLFPNGRWRKSWGRKGSRNGQFIRPYGVDVNRSNRILVADSDNNRIQKFTAKGRFMDRIGSFGARPGQFSQLRRVAVSPGRKSKIYGADLWGWKIVRYDRYGRFDRVFGGTTPPAGRFNEPSGLAVDDGALFVTDAVNQRVQRFDPVTGRYERQWGKRGWGNKDRDGFNWPRGVTIDARSNTVWVADTKNNRLVQFARDGSPTGKKLGVVNHTDAGRMSWPYGVAAVDGDVIVADTRANRVARWDPGIVGTTWSHDSACGKPFTAPYDVDVRGGRAYVADAGNRRIVVLDIDSGACVDEFGAGALHFPQGVAVTAEGDVWVTDTTHNVVVRFGPNGAMQARWGGTGWQHGKFNRPTHIEIANRRMYIADTWNDRVEVFRIGG